MELPKDSVICTIERADHENYQKVIDFLGYAALIPDDIDRLYAKHTEGISPLLQTPAARSAAGLYVLCRKHLVLGTLSLFRLHSTQCSRETRGAVEAAGIAHAINTNPQMFAFFEQDDGSPAARKRTKKAFNSGSIFPPDKPVMSELKGFFDTASLLSHTNVHTYGRHVAATPTPGVGNFSFQDIPRSNIERDLPTFMFWMCLAHLAILKVADSVFPDITPSLEKFASDRATVFERFCRFSDKAKTRSCIGNVKIPELPRSI